MDNHKHIKTLLVVTVLSLFQIFIGCSSYNSSNSNLYNKESSDTASGGFVWGHNDKKTGEPQEELSNEEILRRQREVLKRQEVEKERLEREKQDILRQEQYNRQLQSLQ